MADIARALDRVAWNYRVASRRVASRPSSFFMASTSNISNPTFLTENDIPGASLLERKPEELKISEIKFLLKCCGDARTWVHGYIRPYSFWTEQVQKLLSYYFEHFIKFAYAKLFNWNCLKNKNSDCEVLWTAICFYIQIFLIVVNLLVDWELIPYMNKFLLFCSCNLLWVEIFPTCLIFNLLCFKVC